jgi:hypothetical protein
VPMPGTLKFGGSHEPRQTLARRRMARFFAL